MTGGADARDAADDADDTDTTGAFADRLRALTAEGRHLLADVEDNVFSFDDPAFYWYCQFLSDPARSADAGLGSIPAATAWRPLLERPSDYRGEWIAVAGILQRKTAFRLPNRHGGMYLYQSELSTPDSRGFCTIITTDDPQGVPLRSRVRVAGFFLKVRAYTDAAGNPGRGPLIVARALLVDAAPAGPIGPGAGSASRYTSWWVMATGVLAVVWWILRRRTGGSGGVAGKRIAASDRAAAEADFDWLVDDRRDE